MTPAQPAIVCFSHIPWCSAATPRPREILTRLAAKGHRVLYFECVGREQAAQPIIRQAGGGEFPPVQVTSLSYSLAHPRERLTRWRSALRAAWILERHRVVKPILWYYHPALFSLGYSHPDSATVYDLIEDFSEWQVAMPDIFFDEIMMVAEADVVFVSKPALEMQVHEMQRILQVEAAERGHKNAMASPVISAPGPSPEDAYGWDSLVVKMHEHLIRIMQKGSAQQTDLVRKA